MDPSVVAVSQTEGGCIEYDAGRVRSRDLEEARAMESRQQLTKSLLGNDMMLLARYGATGEAFEIDLTAVPEINTKSRSADLEIVTFGVGENNMLEFRRLVTTRESQQQHHFHRHEASHLKSRPSLQISSLRI